MKNLSVIQTEVKAPTVKSFVKTLPKQLGTIDKIVLSYQAGYSRSELVKAGFNPSTVYRQVRERVINA